MKCSNYFIYFKRRCFHYMMLPLNLSRWNFPFQFSSIYLENEEGTALTIEHLCGCLLAGNFVKLRFGSQCETENRL